MAESGNNNELFRLDGPLHRFFDIFYGMVVVGLLWIVFCIPVFTAGAATTAAYYTMVKVVRMQEGKMTQQFFKSFQQNFNDATILNFIYCVLLVLAGWNCFGMYQIYQTEQSTYYVAAMLVWGAITIFVFWLSHWSYFFLSRFVAKPMAIIKMAMWAEFRHILSTILMILLFALCMFLIYFWNPGILIFPGLYLYASSFLVEKVFHLYMPKETNREPEYDDNGNVIQTWYEGTAPTKEEKKLRQRDKTHLHRYSDYHRKKKK